MAKPRSLRGPKEMIAPTTPLPEIEPLPLVPRTKKAVSPVKTMAPEE